MHDDEYGALGARSTSLLRPRGLLKDLAPAPSNSDQTILFSIHFTMLLAPIEADKLSHSM